MRIFAEAMRLQYVVQVPEISHVKRHNGSRSEHAFMFAQGF